MFGVGVFLSFRVKQQLWSSLYVHLLAEPEKLKLLCADSSGERKKERKEG